jgi:hypothetical protein
LEPASGGAGPLLRWVVAGVQAGQQGGGPGGLMGSTPTCSFSVICSGEVFHGLGIQGAKVAAFLVLYLSQVCPQCLSKVTDSQSSCSLQLCPTHHLGFVQEKLS